MAVKLRLSKLVQMWEFGVNVSVSFTTGAARNEALRAELDLLNGHSHLPGHVDRPGAVSVLFGRPLAAPLGNVPHIAVPTVQPDALQCIQMGGDDPPVNERNLGIALH